MPSALIRISPLSVVQIYGSVPDRIVIDGVDVHMPAIGWLSPGGHMLASLTVVKTGAIGQFAVLDHTDYVLAGNVLTATEVYVERVLSAAELKSYAAGKRAQKAAGGTALGATPIPTDLDTRTMLLGFYVKSLATPSFTTPWRTPTGVITLNANNIQAAAAQVGLFLADCLQREVDAIAGIDGSTITTPAQIDAIFAS